MSSSLKEFFNEITLPSYVNNVYQRIVARGFDAYIVGGFVRDHLLQKKKGDIDIATNAPPTEIMKIFPHTVPTGLQHGTVMVIEQGQTCEVTTYRIDGKYQNYRQPQKVFFSKTILVDLKRRDFTINAFAYHPDRKTILDCFGGYQDLQDKIIKAIGDPEQRFNEDALRMLRACRLASQIDFKIADDVLLAIKKLAKNIIKISIERIREELIKILISAKPSIGIEYLRKTNLLSLILPELSNTIGIIQNQYHAYDVYQHSLAVVDALTDNHYPLRLAALLHDIGKPQTQELKKGHQNEYTFYGHENVGENLANELLKRLKFSKKDRFFVQHLIKHHMFHYTDEWSESAIRRFIRRIGPEMLPFLFKLRIADDLGKGTRLEFSPTAALEPLQKRIVTILNQKAALSLRELAINGKDLMQSFDLLPSEQIGKLLKFLLEEVIENPHLNTKEQLLKKAKKKSKKVFYHKTP